MARIQQDQFIDEDEEEEVCPLCVEEFDLGDRYFKPCPCGYQVSWYPQDIDGRLDSVSGSVKTLLESLVTCSAFGLS
jgi:hypothetical protein